MKILLYSTDFRPNTGGIAVFLHNLCVKLNSYGHKVDVLTIRRGAVYEDMNFPYRVYRFRYLKFFSSLLPIFKTIYLYIKKRYDIVFLGQVAGTHAFGALILKIIFDVPYVVLSHGNDLRYNMKGRVYKYAARLVLDNAAAVLCNSEFTAVRVKQACRPKTLEILYPGVDAGLFCPQNTRNEFDKHYGLPGKKIILTAARLTAKKNIDAVISALPNIISQIKDVVYLVAGEGPERKSLIYVADKMGCGEYVKFLGYIDNEKLPLLYQNCDVFICPSRSEGLLEDIETFGISYLEAAACGKPVVASTVGGGREAVMDGKTGILVEPLDIRGISETVIKLLADKSYADELGKNARIRIIREFSWEMAGRKLEKYLSGAVS